MKTSKLFFSNIIYYYQVSNTNIKTLVFADNPSRNISRNLLVHAPQAAAGGFL